MNMNYRGFAACCAERLGRSERGQSFIFQVRQGSALPHLKRKSDVELRKSDAEFRDAIGAPHSKRQSHSLNSKKGLS
jgi:hypothetical protein